MSVPHEAVGPRDWLSGPVEPFAAPEPVQEAGGAKTRKWARGPSWASVRGSWDAQPEWPRGYRRLVRGARIWWHGPNHTGAFQKMAFTVRQRALRRAVPRWAALACLLTSVAFVSMLVHALVPMVSR